MFNKFKNEDEQYGKTRIKITQNNNAVGWISKSPLDSNPLLISLNINFMNKDKKFSFFGANGIGKSTVSNCIYKQLLKKEKNQYSEKYSLSFNKPNVNIKNKIHNKKYTFLIYSIIDTIKSNSSILLPKDAEYLLYQYSFTRNLSHFFLEERTKDLKQKVKHINSLIFQPNYLYNDINIMLTEDIPKTEKIKDIHSRLSGDCIFTLAKSIEITASYFKIPINKFLILLKAYSSDCFFSSLSREDFKFFQSNYLLDHIFILLDNEVLCDFYITYYDNLSNNPNYFTFKKEISKFNKHLESIFPAVEQLFQTYFTGFFKSIKLNKRYNSSLGEYIYDLNIFDLFGNKISLERFLNETGSESERKMINFLRFYIEISMFKKRDILLIADDIFDSFDNLNCFNFLTVLNNILEQNKNIIFVSFTHDYELFRMINNKLNIPQKNITLLSRNRKDKTLDLIPFPVRKNFYKDYLVNKKTNSIEEEILLIISTIPYYRNIIEISNGEQSKNYIDATNFLHYKHNNSRLLIEFFPEFIFNKFGFIKNKAQKNKIIEFLDNNSNYDILLEKIFNTIFVIQNQNINFIEYRIFLSIYGRLLIESWIVKYIKKYDPSFNPLKINSGQMGELFKKLDEITKKQKINLSQLRQSFEQLNFYLPSYIHFGDSDIAYLINIDSSVLLESIQKVKNEIQKIPVK